MAEFSYTTIALPASAASLDRAVIQRPLLSATIRLENGSSTRLSVLPDSGADSCLLPLNAAIALGIDVGELPHVLTGGVGNSRNLTYLSRVSFDLGHGLSFMAPVGFTVGLNSAGLGLLGQFGFFDKFNVEFRLRENRFTVELAG